MVLFKKTKKKKPVRNSYLNQNTISFLVFSSKILIMMQCHWTVYTDLNVRSKWDKVYLKIFMSCKRHIFSKGITSFKTFRAKMSIQKLGSPPSVPGEKGTMAALERTHHSWLRATAALLPASVALAEADPSLTAVTSVDKLQWGYTDMCGEINLYSNEWLHKIYTNSIIKNRNWKLHL